MNKIFQISLITSVLATAGFADQPTDPIPVDVYGKLELNGGTDTADSTVRASGTLNVVADSALESVLTLEQGAVMDVAAGVTLTNSGEIQINPSENAQVQKYINKTMYYEFDDGGTKVYCENAEGSGGFVDKDGAEALPTETPTKSMHTTITGSPTGDGTIDMDYDSNGGQPITTNLEITWNISYTDNPMTMPITARVSETEYNGVDYYTYKANRYFAGALDGITYIYAPNNCESVKAIHSNGGENQLADNDKNIVMLDEGSSQYYTLSCDMVNMWDQVQQIKTPVITGKITSETATVTYVKEGAATLDSDATDLTEKLTGITNQYALSSAKSTGWSENWIKNLPTIKYNDGETDHVFDKTGTADEIAAGPEAYLNGFGIYPNAVNDSSTTALELLESKASSDAINIPAASTIAVDVDATVSANLHNIGESSATTAFSGDGVLTLSGNNQYLGGEVSFNKVAISSQNSIPGGDVTVNTSLQVSSDADLTGTLTMSNGSALSVDEGKSLKVFGTLTLE